MSESSIIVTSAENGMEKELLTTPENGRVSRKWWPILDENDICRYCLHAYPHCTCEEAEDDQ